MNRVVRVLVADDSATFVAAVLDVVEIAAGFEVVAVVRSGEEAVEAARATSPDLVLMDVHMPGIGGDEAARRIRAVSPQTVVVMLTATPDDEAGAESADWVVEKPTLMPDTLSRLWARVAERDAHDPTRNAHS